jgi:branched-chain amino acid transport system permease protein
VILLRPSGLISLIVSERERIGTFGRPNQSSDHGRQGDDGAAA